MIHNTNRRKDKNIWLFTSMGFPIGYIEPTTPAMKAQIIQMYRDLPLIEGETMETVRDRLLDLLDASAISYTYYQIEGLIL